MNYMYLTLDVVWAAVSRAPQISLHSTGNARAIFERSSHLFVDQKGKLQSNTRSLIEIANEVIKQQAYHFGDIAGY